MPKRRTKNKERTPLSPQLAEGDSSMARTSSLNQDSFNHVIPRTPTGRKRSGLEDGENDIELNLLSEDEQRANGHGRDEFDVVAKQPMSTKDKKAMALLCILCTCYRNLHDV